MKKIRFLNFIIIAGMIFCAPVFAIDKSIDCAGRPRWDRFVVNTDSTKWDAENVKCFETPTGAAKNMYGAASVYGEYNEFETNIRAQNMYGIVPPQNDNIFINYKNMYGKYNAEKPSVKTVKPARASMHTEKPIKKLPIKIAPKPVKNTKILRPEIAPIIIEKKPVSAPTVKIEPMMPAAIPSLSATEIRDNLNNNFDINSYCTSINYPVMGPMPPGIVLMPGRPDLMSCVKK